jgi:ketosteroid isomerase-like protein
MAAADPPVAGRHVEERLALAAPRLFRQFRRLAFKLPPSSPVRRRIVKRAAALGWEALARGDIDATVLVVDPDYELNLIGEGFQALGFHEHYKGHGGMIEFTEQWRTAWSNLDYEVHQIFDFGDRIAMRLTTTSRGAMSGIEVSRTAGSVYFMSGGTVVRQDFYWDWPDCAAALGLADLRPARG